MPNSSASRLDDPEYIKLHLKRFLECRSDHEHWARWVADELRKRITDPLTGVTVRVKDPDSFARKLIRKRADYERRYGTDFDPLIVMTDLVGARVVVMSDGDLSRLAKRLSTGPEAFLIDRHHSQDAGARLRTSEFGYRSIHYVIQTPETGQPGCPALRIEIQLRTALQNVWADMDHDLSYKSNAVIPDRIRRQFAALAAMLETADGLFNDLHGEYREFQTAQGMHLGESAGQKEIQRLTAMIDTLTGSDPTLCAARIRLTLRRAQLRRERGELDPMITELRDSADLPHSTSLRHLLGRTLCEWHRSNRHGAEFQDGLRILEELAQRADEDPHAGGFAEILSDAAVALNGDELRQEDAQRLHLAAVSRDDAEPLTLTRHLEFSFSRTQSLDLLGMVRPMLRRSLRRCEVQVEGQVNLGAAWRCAVTLHLLLGQPGSAVHALARLATLCRPAPTNPPSTRMHCEPGRNLDELELVFARFKAAKRQLAGFDSLQLFHLLLLHHLVPARRTELLKTIRGHRSPGIQFPKDRSILWVAGACAQEFSKDVARFEQVLQPALADLSICLVSGNSDQGICESVARLSRDSRGRIRHFGYGIHIPGQYPGQVVVHSGPPPEFSIRQPLQSLLDLSADGIDPRRIRLLAYAGGDITDQEIVVALALGIRVGVVMDPALPPERNFALPGWGPEHGLLRLPMDADTLRAFLSIDDIGLDPVEKAALEPAARAVHEHYLASTNPNEASRQRWEKLDEDLKASCFHQLTHAKRDTLVRVGLEVVAETDPRPAIQPDELTDGTRTQLARAEHGRWNVERLLLGWQPGPKDVSQKRNPSIAPWDQLDARTQGYDFQAINDLAKALAKAGMKIVKRE